MPLPEDVQKKIMAGRKASLMKVLKKSGDSGFFTGLSVSVNIFLRSAGIRVRQSGNYRITVLLAFSAASLLLIAGISGFSGLIYKESAGPAHVILAAGDVHVRHRGNAPEKLKVLDKVSAGDAVMAGKDSHLMIQIGSKGVIILSPDSAAEITGLGKGRIEVSLNNGRILSKVAAPGQGPAFVIRSPNAAAEAVGTEFTVAYDGNTSIISLGKGRLKITCTGSGEEVFMDRGNTALVGTGITFRAISRVEMLEIKKISRVDFVVNPEKTGRIEIERKSRIYLQDILEMNREIDDITRKNSTLRGKELEQWKKLPPLERLRREGKIITMLHLKDGSMIAGSIISQDEGEMKFDTADGIIIIPKNDIIRRAPLD